MDNESPLSRLHDTAFGLYPKPLEYNLRFTKLLHHNAF